jgi:hypothetical protein
MRGQWKWQAATAIAVAQVSLTFAVTAHAASVRVDESGEGDLRGFAPAVLYYDAGPDEASHLTVSVVSESDGFFHLEIIDTRAAIHSGPGCTGGGIAGVAISCTLRMPLAPEINSCARPCGPPVARMGWATSFHVSLGNGGSYFDAASLPNASNATYGNGRPAETVSMEVSGGSGDDRVSTAGGNDIIDPGTGADHVSSHGGDDEVKETAQPDGPDVYDLGSITEENSVDFRLRTSPILYNATAGIGGASGENDRISGARVIVGGSADDTIVGGSANESFSGLGGNDELTGKEGRDLLDGGSGDNRLYGDEGTDRLEAEDGADLAEGGYDEDYFRLRGGDDVADGDQGNDRLLLGSGNDRGYGGDGEDTIFGDQGEDTIFGEYASNWVIGGPGADRLVAGVGEDTILAGTNTTMVNEPDPPRYRNPDGGLDSWRDTIYCGDRAAKVSLNPWDDARRCRRTALVRAVELGPTVTDSVNGTAILSVGIRGPGRLKLYGKGISTVLKTPRYMARLRSGDPLRLPIRPRSQALWELRHDHKIRLRIKLRYVPDGGLPRIREATIRLRLNPAT